MAQVVFPSTGAVMALYRLKIFCGACREFHALNGQVDLDLPFPVCAVSDVFGDKDVPEEVDLMITKPLRCPITGSWVAPDDTDHILLVAADA
jgi:hypothetical protein